MNIKNLFGLILISLISCNQAADNKQAAAEVKTVKYIQQKLDSLSDYQISIPENYQIYAEHGFDAAAYRLTPKDTAVNNFGIAKILRAPYDEKPFPDPTIKLLRDSIIKCTILNTQNEWTIFEYPEHYVTAQTSINTAGITYLNLTAEAHSYANLDSLMKILSSLTRVPD